MLHAGEELLASLLSSCPCGEVSVTIHVAGSDVVQNSLNCPLSCVHFRGS